MIHQNHSINYVEFPAHDALPAVKTFYGTVFGWHFQEWGDAYADSTSPGVGVGFDAGKDAVAAPLPVIYAAHLENALAAVQAAGGIISRKIFAFPGGRRFHFIDPAGNELAVWSEH